MDIPPDDGLKWFGEGFDGFPKRLPEDTIEYSIYIVDSRLNDAQARSKLNEISRFASEQAKKLLKDYNWQRDAFALDLKRENDRWLLSGRASFGDSIADEWLIVYLLRELSSRFPEAWIRVVDTDGEFLLIEAANALPKWLNPEVAGHRVWINSGKLHIITMGKGAETSKMALDLEQALDKIRLDGSSLLHSPLVEEEAFYRLQKYPGAIADSMHAALVTIPRKLAYILHAKSSLTSPAVEAFYLRDPISLRPLHQPTPSGLTFPPEDFVTTLAHFNKASFAQLKSQEFSLPKSWENAPFPASSDADDVAKRELGVKLCCGFEMLVQDPQNRDKKPVREIAVLLGDLEVEDETLPTDEEIQSWPKQADSEAWMDIDFGDFERELAGNKKRDSGQPSSSSAAAGPANDVSGAGAGFGDKAAQENLRRMVERFEKWMNDDDAGPDGAEMDDMDFDDDEESSLDNEEDDDDEDEDRAVSFDEDEFRAMMRQMMGLPSDDAGTSFANTQSKKQNRIREDDDVVEIDADESEDEEIRLLSERMEAELNAAGALNLDPTPSKLKAVAGSGHAESQTRAKTDGAGDGEDGHEEEEGAVNIDYNLAKNLLEAFKGQTGMAGPAGNMMGLMGIQMPRDEKDAETKK